MNLTREISKTTNLDEAVLIEKILGVLEKDRYGIMRLTKDCVKFSHRNGRWRWNSEYFGLLDSGEFLIERSNDKNLVILKYLGIPLSEIIFVATIFLFFATSGVINQVYYSFIISLVFPGQLTFKYFNLKNKAEKMLDDITQGM